MKKVNLLAGFASIALAAASATLAFTARAANDDQGEPAEVGALAEATAPNLRIFRTFMVTQDNFLPLSTTPVNAFTPLVVTCPAFRNPNGCTVSVLVRRSSRAWMPELRLRPTRK